MLELIDGLILILLRIVSISEPMHDYLPLQWYINVPRNPIYLVLNFLTYKSDKMIYASEKVIPNASENRKSELKKVIKNKLSNYNRLFRKLRAGVKYSIGLVEECKLSKDDVDLLGHFDRYKNDPKLFEELEVDQEVVLDEESRENEDLLNKASNEDSSNKVSNENSSNKVSNEDSSNKVSNKK